MPLRIVFDGKFPYDVKVLDAETGEDLTRRLQVTKAEITLTSDEYPTVLLTAIPAKVEITVEEAQVNQVCPYCGHETDKTLRSAEDVETSNEALDYQAYQRNLEIMQRDPNYARRANIDVAIRQYEEKHKE